VSGNLHRTSPTGRTFACTVRTCVAAGLGSPRGSLRDELAVFENRDGVGELVRLLEVLRRQEDRVAAGDEEGEGGPLLLAYERDL